jgi:hypothetical protein
MENTASNNSVVACVFIAAGKCLPSRFVAKIMGRTHTQNKVISQASFYLFFKIMN